MIKKKSGTLILGTMLLSSTSFAQQAGWGAAFKDADKKVKIGGRIQAIATNDSDTESQDFYLRRTRFNISYKPWEGHQFVYDIRNDNSNKKDKGEGKFVIGDAYWKIKVDNGWVNNIKLFRSKVDVSYSQTSSSKNLFNPNRANVSEHASDFLVQNRRASNAQINGNFGNLSYHLAVSDGVQADDLADLDSSETTTVEGVNHQKFTYGGKLRYYFMGDAKKNKAQDTFYGQHDTFSLGLGYFANDEINIELSDGRDVSVRRTLTNVELSYAYKNFRLLGEYFTFAGDFVNLTQASKDDMFGTSDGYFVQTEYLIGKWAPYIGYESFNKWNEEDGYVQTVHTYGINYYDHMEARRYGLTYKRTEEEENLSDKVSEQIYAYMMLNF